MLYQELAHMPDQSSLLISTDADSIEEQYSIPGPMTVV